MQHHCSSHRLEALTVCFHDECGHIFLCIICHRNHSKTHAPNIIEVSLLGTAEDQGHETWTENFNFVKKTFSCTAKDPFIKSPEETKVLERVKAG